MVSELLLGRMGARDGAVGAVCGSWEQDIDNLWAA
jgi:hypothetical protein